MTSILFTTWFARETHLRVTECVFEVSDMALSAFFTKQVNGETGQLRALNHLEFRNFSCWCKKKDESASLVVFDRLS